MNIPSLQQEVREELSRLGFTALRFAAPPLGEARQRFSAWLERGFQGEMAYLARRREERLEPSRLLQDLRSVLVLGHPYDCGLPNTERPAEANLSRYAWGEDYHEVLGEKLERFAAWLRGRRPGVMVYSSVDAAPVLEKAWAQQAGLGWLGKHTNMIQAEQGSYFFLAVLFTDLEFTPDAPESDRCGTCTRCIEVCPTRAIVAPYQLDARLCISYLTIELKGPIPRELRPLIGNRVFGCDDCQEVCPWNRFSRPTEEGRFFPREGVRNQPLVSFLELDEPGFKKKFSGSAILRAKRRGFLRNVCVAIGNSGRPELGEALLPLLEDPEPLVRGHAVWALARLCEDRAREALLALRKSEGDPFVLEELRVANIGE
ncbi:MAG: tRNA epoxyqueuosine(34) reductase QueG [bacterium]